MNDEFPLAPGPFESFLLLGSGVYALLAFVLTAWAFIDCLRKGREYWWLWLIFVTGGLGAFAYWFVHYWNGSFSETFARGDAALRRQIKEMQSRVHFCASAANREDLGDLLRKAGRLAEAEKEYRASLELDPDSFGAKTHLGYVLLGLKKYEEAWALLEPAYAKTPEYDGDDLMWNCARCQVARGNLEHAKELYQEFLSRHSYYEAQVEFIELLLRLKEREQARELAQEIVDDLRNSPAYVARTNRRWAKRAKQLLKAC